MKKTTLYSPEVRERAVRMVLEHLNDYPSQWAAIEVIAPKIGCAVQTLHGWVRRQQTDAGQRPWPTSEERERIKLLEGFYPISTDGLEKTENFRSRRATLRCIRGLWNRSI